MLTKVLKSIHTQNGKYAISFILGIGLASLFRKVCNDRNCIVFKAPALEEVTSNIYEYNNKCYSFKEHAVKCGNAEQEVEFA
jgi:hypothetical protein